LEFITQVRILKASAWGVSIQEHTSSVWALELVLVFIIVISVVELSFLN
jgi:hypothetical protein